MNLSTIGGRIRAARQSHKYTLADLVDACGLSKGFLSDIENDKRNPSAANICLLSDALEVSVEWLLRGKSVKPITCPLCRGNGKIEL